jgi:hypothetical protein
MQYKKTSSIYSNTNEEGVCDSHYYFATSAAFAAAAIGAAAFLVNLLDILSNHFIHESRSDSTFWKNPSGLSHMSSRNHFFSQVEGGVGLFVFVSV